MVAVAASYQRPDSALEIIDVEYKLFPQVLQTLTKVWVIAHNRATDPKDGDPVPPAVTNLIDEIAKVSARQVIVAEKIYPLAFKLTRAQREALLDARNARWDHSAHNKGRAA